MFESSEERNIRKKREFVFNVELFFNILCYFIMIGLLPLFAIFFFTGRILVFFYKIRTLKINEMESNPFVRVEAFMLFLAIMYYFKIW